jgi:hypothetical protein
MVDGGEIERALVESRGDLDRALDRLVDAANRSGGIDNITVVAFEIGDSAGDDDTSTLPAVEPPAVDGEDTLDELDAVPVVDTAVIPAADVEREVAEHEARRREAEADADARTHGAGRGGRWLALALLVLAVAVVVGLVLWGFLR